MKVKRSVALAIRPERPGDGEVLIVLRPPDDEELPETWGLPAASLRTGESWEDAAQRAARDKLGVDVRLGAEMESGNIARPGYTLEMRLYGAEIAGGEPRVPQPHANVTQYTDWRWGVRQDLFPAAAQGSLCARLYVAASDAKGGGVSPPPQP